MLNPIKQIVAFNQKANLLDAGYDDALESSFQIEEALEGLSDLHVLATTFGTTNKDPKHLSRIIVGLANSGNHMSDVDRLDKACDAVVFAIGSMAKLGLDSTQITKALNAVMLCNMQKLGMPKDSKGKLIKPANFEGPEPLLQQILDERVPWKS